MIFGDSRALDMAWKIKHIPPLLFDIVSYLVRASIFDHFDLVYLDINGIGILFLKTLFTLFTTCDISVILPLPLLLFRCYLPAIRRLAGKRDRDREAIVTTIGRTYCTWVVPASIQSKLLL